jgi:radical SAM protein with 4Fe4S-binding SPASM domain
VKTSPRRPLVLVPQHFGCLVFDRRTSRYLPFDQPATDLLLALHREPAWSVLSHSSDVARAFYEHFYNLGFFTLEGGFDAEILDIQPLADRLAGPLALHLEVIAACNLACAHCFAGPLPRRDTPLTLAEMESLFDQMAGMGTFRLGLTGGEPLLRKELLEILDAATDRGLHPCLTTNGLLLDERWARELGRRELVWLNVSLEGATAATNDAVRGTGTFDRVLERLQVLRQHARFTLAFTLMSTNRHEVRACAELAREVGAHTAVFRPLYPAGTARHHLELMPSFLDYSEAMDELASLEAGSELRPLDPFNPHLREERQSIIHQNYGCGAGNLVCSVSVSGQVNPCSFLGSGFDGGNIRERPLAEIWHESEVFRSMRELEPEAEDGSRFAGGCRARALVLNGSIHAPDPWLEGGMPAGRSPLVVLDVNPGVR